MRDVGNAFRNSYVPRCRNCVLGGMPGNINLTLGNVIVSERVFRNLKWLSVPKGVRNFPRRPNPLLRLIQS